MMWASDPRGTCAQCGRRDSFLSEDMICASCADDNAEKAADYAEVLASYADDEREAA